MIDARITEITNHKNKVVLTIEFTPDNIKLHKDKNRFEEIRDELNNGSPLVEHYSLLPIGRSTSATLTKNGMSCNINIPKGIDLNNHSYQSTDDVIEAIKAELITEVSIRDGHIKLGTNN